MASQAQIIIITTTKKRMMMERNMKMKRLVISNYHFDPFGLQPIIFIDDHNPDDDEQQSMIIDSSRKEYIFEPTNGGVRLESSHGSS